MENEKIKIYNKLVRDKIPEIIESTGKMANYFMCDDEDDFIGVVKNKIKEEVEELLSANKIEDIIEEEADLLEILQTFNDIKNIRFIDVIPVMANKSKEKGKFDKKIILVSTFEK